jgi:Tfp pilus assembly protein PilV
MSMRALGRRGESLIELIVALVILEVVGASSLAAALAIERLGRHASHGSADDAARWHDYRAAETRVGCAQATAPDSIPLVFPLTADRPALATLLRCGR